MADEDWNDLGAVWQEKSEIDVAGLTRNVRKRMRLMYAWFICEMLVAFAGVVFGVYWMLYQAHDFIIGLVFFAFSAGGGYLAWWARKGAWYVPEGSALEELKFARRRAESGVRYALVNLWMSPVALALSALVLWHQYDGINISESELTRWVFIILFLVTFIPGCVIWSVWYRGKKSKEVRDLDRIISDMEQE